MGTFYFKQDASGARYKSTGPWHSKVGSLVVVEWDNANQIFFANGNDAYNINTSSDVININDAVVSGTAEQKYDAIRAVFPKANSGSSGSGLPAQTGNAGEYLTTDGTNPIWAAGPAGIELSATKSAVSSSTSRRLVYVTADETNNGDTSLYIHNGTMLKLLQTVALLLVVFLLNAQTPQITYVVPSVVSMKAYYGNANRIYISATNKSYNICSPCTADEVNIFAGAGGRKWRFELDSVYSSIGKTYTSITPLPDSSGVILGRPNGTMDTVKRQVGLLSSPDNIFLAKRQDNGNYVARNNLIKTYGKL